MKPIATTTINDIRNLAETAGAANQNLKEEITILQHELQRISEAHRKVIDGAIAKARNAQAKLAAAVAAHPEMFTNPKTLTIAGMKIGFAKAQDKRDIPNEAATITMIRENLPDLASLLVKTAESVVKAALKQLTAEQLLSIGVLLTEGEDEVVCSHVEGDADKIAATLIKAAVEKATEQ